MLATERAQIVFVNQYTIVSLAQRVFPTVNPQEGEDNMMMHTTTV